MLEGRCEFLGYGWMQGELFEVDGYPGAVVSDDPDNTVNGELYRISNPELLTMLDTYEECSDSFPQPHEYIRTRVAIHQHAGEPIPAWVYLYSFDTSELEHLDSGTYVK